MKTTINTSSTKLGTGGVFGSMVLAMAAALSFTVPNLALAQESHAIRSRSPPFRRKSLMHLFPPVASSIRRYRGTGAHQLRALH